MSAVSSSSIGHAEPIWILISSAVRSPIASENSFLTYCSTASSSSSPATRTDWAVTIPPSEITATSVVPPPMSTIMLPGRLVHRQVGADRRRHRLLDDVHRLAGAGVLGGVLHGALLDAGDAGRHADDHPRLAPLAGVHLLDEVAQHLLAHLEVGDHAVLERPDGLDVVGRAAHHPLGLEPDRDGTAVVDVDRHDRGLVEHDALAADVDQCVGGAEVDREVATQAERIVTCHVRTPSTDDRVAGHWPRDRRRAASIGTKCYRFGKKIPISRSALSRASRCRGRGSR